MSKHDTLDLLRRLDPVAGDDPAQAVRAESRDELLTRIGQTPPPAPKAPKSAVRRRLVPVLVATAVIAATAVCLVELPGDSRQEALGPALSFSSEGDYLRVRIVDPAADTARYNKEFKKRHLNITLELLPGSPSTVGLSPAAAFGPDSDNIQQSEDPEGCVEAGTYPCVPQFLIPKNYSGEAGLVIARATRPGEKVQFTGPIDGRGEALEGVKYKNLRVSQVLAILKQRGYTVPEYRLLVGSTATAPKSVPANYFVKGGFLIKDKDVILDVSAKR
ncbi:hypothetical protein E0H73_28940 [Kribbella pittospori]|uniref:Uncharacterized protein n=1 Tax=Kribbella pittospori TaxID=722689 RepID=A0A4R0KCM8_9ACTN|nr:hypothetical protein [Kribbella pittospori]TCC57420.1 hypothetical protein E0H73_28940 [Kribbella pittospori]